MRISTANPFLLDILKKGEENGHRIAMGRELIYLLGDLDKKHLRFLGWVMDMVLDAPTDTLYLAYRHYVWWCEERGFPEVSKSSYMGTKRSWGKMLLLFPVEGRVSFYYINPGMIIHHSQVAGIGRKVGAIMKLKAREVLDARNRLVPSVVVVEKETGEIIDEEDWGE